MKKIIWKNFRSNLKNFTVFFMSAVVSVAIIFSFNYMNAITKGVTVNGMPSIAGWFLDKLVPVLVVVSIFVMNYSAKFYIRTRIRDYSLFMILGIPRKMLQLLIAFEYALSWMIAIAVGLLSGNLVVKTFRIMLDNVMGTQSYGRVGLMKIYGMTAVWCILLLVGVIFNLYTYLKENDLSELMQSSIKPEKNSGVKYWYVFTGLGFILAIGSLAAAFAMKEISKNTGAALAVVCSVGVYLILRFGASALYGKIKRKGSFYYKRILIWNHFYYRFQNNIQVIFVQFVIGVFGIYFAWFAMTVGESIKADGSAYPYDYVCKGGVKGNESLKEIGNRYGSMSEEFSYLTVYNFNEDPKIAIDEKTYSSLWTENLNLNEGELYYLMFTDSIYDLDRDPGSETNIYVGMQAKMSQQKVKFIIKGTKKGRWLGSFLPTVIVMDNKDYKELCGEYQSQEHMFVMKTEQTHKKSVDSALAKLADRDSELKVYDKAGLLTSDNLNYYVLNAVLIFSGITILFYLFFMISMKMYADVPEMKAKYLFLERLGMRREDMKKTLKKETGYILLSPVCIAGIAGSIMCLGLGQKIFSNEDAGVFGQAAFILPQLLVYVGMEILLTVILHNRLRKEIIIHS